MTTTELIDLYLQYKKSENDLSWDALGNKLARKTNGKNNPVKVVDAEDFYLVMSTPRMCHKFDTFGDAFKYISNTTTSYPGHTRSCSSGLICEPFDLDFCKDKKVLDIRLVKDAKVINKNELEKAKNQWNTRAFDFSNLSPEIGKEIVKLLAFSKDYKTGDEFISAIINSEANLAMLVGYDVIFDEKNNRYQVLSRSKVVISDVEDFSIRLEAARESERMKNSKII